MPARSKISPLADLDKYDFRRRRRRLPEFKPRWEKADLYRRKSDEAIKASRPAPIPDVVKNTIRCWPPS